MSHSRVSMAEKRTSRAAIATATVFRLSLVRGLGLKWTIFFAHEFSVFDPSCVIRSPATSNGCAPPTTLSVVAAAKPRRTNSSYLPTSKLCMTMTAVQPAASQLATSVSARRWRGLGGEGGGALLFGIFSSWSCQRRSQTGNTRTIEVQHNRATASLHMPY
jgi:hypothetical protein